MFKADNPITTLKDDLLNRVVFSEELAKAILSFQSKNSIVIGLYGEWGSGKTSIINMILEVIENFSNTINLEEKPIIINFNPWNFADQNQLINQFFKQLSLNLRKKEHGKIIERTGELIEIYGNIFNLIPLYGNTISNMVKNTGKALKDFGIQNQNDLIAIKEKLNKCLSDQKHKIIIIIDDIDRLSSIEIKQIFQLVKSLGDFPNTVYLLSFDKRVIINALMDIQNIPGEKYLEKVIQIPFEIPLLNRRELENILFHGIDELIKDIPDKKWNKVYWGNIYQSGIKYFFKTIRDVNRYLNSLYFNFGLVKGEVNTIDFLSITAIQVFLPNVYYAIREKKSLLTELFNSGLRSIDKEKEDEKILITEIINLVDTERINKEKFINLLKVMFPKLESIFGNISWTSNFLSEWTKDCRICSPNFFGRYFHLSVLIGEISQKEIEAILSIADKPKEFSEAVLKLEKDKILDFIDKLENYTKEDIPIENIKPIIEVLMDISDILPEPPKGFFSLDATMNIIRIIRQLIDRIEDNEERFLILKNAIEKSERSILIICEEISLRYEELKKQDSGSTKTLNEDQLKKLTELACSKIKNWVNSNKFFNIKNLPYVLYRWKRWEDEKIVLQTVEELINSDINMVKFLSSFVREQSSYGGGDYIGREERVINFKEIGDFIDVNILTPRVRKIFQSEIFSDLDEADRITIELFLKEIESFNKN